MKFKILIIKHIVLMMKIYLLMTSHRWIRCNLRTYNLAHALYLIEKGYGCGKGDWDIIYYSRNGRIYGGTDAIKQYQIKECKFLKEFNHNFKSDILPSKSWYSHVFENGYVYKRIKLW
jgi:hypothetical protein